MCGRPSQASRMQGLLFQLGRGQGECLHVNQWWKVIFVLWGRCFVTIFIHVANTYVM
jgi:hypothetical protein